MYEPVPVVSIAHVEDFATKEFERQSEDVLGSGLPPQVGHTPLLRSVHLMRVGL